MLLTLLLRHAYTAQGANSEFPYEEMVGRPATGCNRTAFMAKGVRNGQECMPTEVQNEGPLHCRGDQCGAAVSPCKGERRGGGNEDKCMVITC